MKYRNIKPITVLCQTDSRQSAMYAADSAIICVLYFAGVLAEYQRLFSGNKGVYCFQKPLFNTDSYIVKARKESSVAGQINASTLLYSVRDDPSRSAEERYDVMVTKEALHWGHGSTRNIGGLGLINTGAVVSYNSIAHLLKPIKGEDNKTWLDRFARFSLLIKMLNIHELCHVFGLWPYNGPANATDEDLKNAHCQNECVMQWTITEDLANKIKDRPLCKTCLINLKGFFI